MEGKLHSMGDNGRIDGDFLTGILKDVQTSYSLVNIIEWSFYTIGILTQSLKSISQTSAEICLTKESHLMW